MIARRHVLTGLAITLTSPSLVRGQDRPPRRLGYLHGITLDPNNSTLQVLRPQWLRLGFVEGQTVLLRSGEGDPARLPGLVADLISQNVTVIIAVGAEAVRAAAAGTKTVAIVAIDLETNPITTGLAASHARPGGNVTGVFLDQPSLAAKWLDLLRDAVPSIEQVGFVWDPSTGREQLDVARAKAADRGLRAAIVEWRQVGSFEEALAPFRGTRTGLVTLTAPGFSRPAGALNRAAAFHRIPAIVFLKAYLLGGAVMSYGPDQAAHFGRAMVLVERILAGASPAELPLELPSRFELVLDVRAARAVGVTLPPILLASADEVIE
jgi:putative ABC transport system substrate-binding protein